MSSDLEAPARDQTPGASDPDTADGSRVRRSHRSDLAAIARRLAQRDVLGVNSAVLVVLAIPILFGWYSCLHWPANGWDPDSRYYITMTLRDMGKPAAAAIAQQNQASGNLEQAWFYSAKDPVWGIVQPRMVYPLLSVPFVWIFGLQDGVIMVPLLSVGVAVFAVARLTQRLWGPFAALAAGGVLAAGGFVMAAEPLTDPVAAGVVALLLPNLPLGRRAKGHNLIFLGLLTVLACLTRQVEAVVAGIAFGGWLWSALFPAVRRPGLRARLRNDWLLPSTVVIGSVFTVQFLVGQFTYSAVNVLAGSDEPTYGSYLRHLPSLAWSLTKADALSAVQGDRFQAFVLIAPVLYALLQFKKPYVGAYLGALAGTYAIIIVGVTPSGMRYESIIMPISAVAVGGLAHLFMPTALRDTADKPDSGSSAAPTWWQGRPYRVPALGAASVALLAFVVGWSATHGSRSLIGEVPTSPPDAAAMAGSGLVPLPVASHDGGDVTVSQAMTAGAAMYADGDSNLWQIFDWRHPARYRPTGPDDPGWADRAADGTTVIQYGDFTHKQFLAFGGALSLQGTLDMSTFRVNWYARSTYGEQLTFTVADSQKKIHRGHATVVYAMAPGIPNTVTELVFDP